MKSENLQAFEHNLNVPDEVMFRKKNKQGPPVGTRVHPPIRNHKWRVNGFTTERGAKDERLTITEDGYRWET